MVVSVRKPLLFQADHTAELVTRIQAGDREAESEFAETFSYGLMKLLLKITKDLDIAKDCCQQTLLITLNKMRAGGIVNPESLRSFLRCTAANVAITYFRKEKRYTCLGDKFFLLQSETGNTAARDKDFETIRSLLHGILDQLKVSRDKEILQRFYLQEENKSDICSDFGIKSEHFDRVLYRAKIRMCLILDSHKDVKALLFNSLC